MFHLFYISQNIGSSRIFCRAHVKPYSVRKVDRFVISHFKITSTKKGSIWCILPFIFSNTGCAHVVYSPKLFFTPLNPYQHFKQATFVFWSRFTFLRVPYCMLSLFHDKNLVLLSLYCEKTLSHKFKFKLKFFSTVFSWYIL